MIHPDPYYAGRRAGFEDMTRCELAPGEYACLPPARRAAMTDTWLRGYRESWAERDRSGRPVLGA